MENGNTLNTNRPELEAAEQKNYENYERETHESAERRALESQIGQKSLRSFDATRSSESPEVSRHMANLDAIFTSLDPSEFFQESEFSEEIQQIGEREQKAIDAMRKLIWGNLVSAGRESLKLQRERQGVRLMLRGAEERKLKRTPYTDACRKRIESLDSDIEALTEQTPESYTLVHGLELRENVAQINHGEMVTTPYVDENLEAVEKRILKGEPTFIHGHTGGGKTELAINAAKNALIDRAAYMEATDELAEYLRANPGASFDERAAILDKAYRRHSENFKQALRNGNKEASKRFSPYMISASKDTLTQDLFSDKTLQLSTIFNGKSLSEHREVFEKEVEDWESKHPNASKDERESARSELFDLYKTRVSGFGTEVKEVAKAVLKAIREGRPVIIDEANMIPPDVMASLNNILNKRPGDFCDIPTTEPEMIRPGFAVIMTSNLSSGRIEYFGTQEMNQATMDRFRRGEKGVIDYDYLPMSTTGDYDNQSDPEKNELFHVAIASLADKKGNLSLPEMERSLDKIFSLCQLARRTQDIFSGQERGEITLGSGHKITSRLNKSVMSMRGLLGVLETWRKGSEMDLDMALWNGFISGITDSDDKNLIISLAQEYNFFAESDGYALITKAPGESPTLFGELHPGGKPYFEQSPMETISIRKVVELLYGPGPERELYPEDIDLGEVINEADDEMLDEDYETYGNKIAEIDKTIAALEVLGEQCGCTVEHNNTES